MAQDISLLGAVYSDVPSVLLPKQGGGTAQFDDTTDADATASDILSGKTAYVNGVKITGTGTGGGSVTQDQDGFIVLPPTGGGDQSAKVICLRIKIVNGTNSSVSSDDIIDYMAGNYFIIGGHIISSGTMYDPIIIPANETGTIVIGAGGNSPYVEVLNSALPNAVYSDLVNCYTDNYGTTTAVGAVEDGNASLTITIS